MRRESGIALIGYDGSESSAAAIGHAGRLLAPRPAVVVCVWDSLAGLLLHTDVDGLTGTMREAAAELDEQDQDEAAAVALRGAELARAAGFDAEPRAVEGEPKAWPALLAEADARDAAVIVVGCRGLGGVKSVLFGSTSSGILHHSARPVLVVPPTEDDAPPGPVIVGFDGSPSARAAVSAVAELLSVREAVIETVWTPYTAVAAAGAAAAPVALVTQAAEDLNEEIAAGARHTAEEGARLAAAGGLEARAEPAEARPNVWRALMESAHSHRAAAIVVGSRGHTAIGGAVLGSVSSALLHNAPVPILVVRPHRE
jgi:nucleotide-binding universal stress UspA family protein